MGRPTKEKITARVIRWVDRDLANYWQAVAHMLGFIPILVVLIANFFFDGPVMNGAWVLAIGLCVVWTLFVLWRGARLIKAMSIKGDKEFDREGKFLLSPEYHQSESVTAAAQRKRSQRRRSPRP